MKALFITTTTSDCSNHLQAWESVYGKTETFIFDHLHRGIHNHWQLLEKANEVEPDVMFYIGACTAFGNPKPSVLRDLRKVAPLVSLISDAADPPWHSVLKRYRADECFDLQVAIDGARDAPVDLAVVTPVDPAGFAVRRKRDIRCGFSGTLAKEGPRADVHRELRDVVTVRRRGDSYKEHAEFLTRCEIVLNTSWTAGNKHHVKGRPLEAGWAGCALLEPAKSPLKDWFPEGTFMSYRSASEARNFIECARDVHLLGTALHDYCQKHYRPEQIYGEILERLADVRPSFTWSAP